MFYGVSLLTQTYDNMHMATATTPMADIKQHITAANTCSPHQPTPQPTASTQLLPPHPWLTQNNTLQLQTHAANTNPYHSWQHLHGLCHYTHCWHQPIPQLTPSTYPWPTLNNNSISHILIGHMPISCTLISCILTSHLLDMHLSAAYLLASIGLYIITFTSINTNTTLLMQYLPNMWLHPMQPSQITHYAWCGLFTYTLNLFPMYHLLFIS